MSHLRDWLAELHSLLSKDEGRTRNPSKQFGDLDNGLRRLDAALEGCCSSDADAAFRATLELYRVRLDSQRAEIKGLVKDLARSKSQAQASERSWQTQQSEALGALAREQERSTGARREAKAMRQELEDAQEQLAAEHRAHERAALRLATLEGTVERQARQCAHQEALLVRLQRRLGREREWRAASLQWLRSELRIADEMDHFVSHLRASASPRPHATPRAACVTTRPSSAPALKSPLGSLSPARVCGQAGRWREEMDGAVRSYDRHHRHLKDALARLQGQLDADSDGERVQ